MPKGQCCRGVDLAIFEAAGRNKLFAARAEIGEMKSGEAAYTPAFDLRAKYIIHTVGPAWRGGNYGERDTVAACYRNSLGLALSPSIMFDRIIERCIKNKNHSIYDINCVLFKYDQPTLGA